MIKTIYTESISLFKNMCIHSSGKARKREMVCLESLPEECKQCWKRATYQSNLELKGILKLLSSHFYFSDMELKRGCKKIKTRLQNSHREKPHWNSDLLKTYSEFSLYNIYSIL